MTKWNKNIDQRARVLKIAMKTGSQEEKVNDDLEEHQDYYCMCEGF